MILLNIIDCLQYNMHVIELQEVRTENVAKLHKEFLRKNRKKPPEGGLKIGILVYY